MTRSDLESYRSMVKEADGIKRQLFIIQSKLQSPGAINYGKPPSKGGKDITGDMIASYVDRQAHYADLLKRIQNKLMEIEKAIDTLSPIKKAIVRGRYIDGLPAWRIAEQIEYSERQTKRLLYAAIEELGRH